MAIGSEHVVGPRTAFPINSLELSELNILKIDIIYCENSLHVYSKQTSRGLKHAYYIVKKWTDCFSVLLFRGFFNINRG